MNRYKAWTLLVIFVAGVLTGLAPKPAMKMRDVITLNSHWGTTVELLTDAQITITDESWFVIKSKGRIETPDKVEGVGYSLSFKEDLTHARWKVTGSPLIELTPIHDYNYVHAKVGPAFYAIVLKAFFAWLVCGIVWLFVVATMLRLEKR